MLQNTRYAFRPATLADLRLLRDWQYRPHVRLWWGSDDLFTQADLDNPLFRQWVVYNHDDPFAYLQDYDVHQWDVHPFSELPARSVGIDQYIGPPEMTGIGHGRAFIGQHMRTLFERDVPAIGADPNPSNARAIAVYRKLGFEIMGPPQRTSWGIILPMVAYAAR